MKSNRDDFSGKTKIVLQNRAGNHCSRCRDLTSGPNADPEKATKIGVAAHITAASPGGPRYDKNLSPEQRRSARNGIWLCRKCAEIVDMDSASYPASLLSDLKESAEREAGRYSNYMMGAFLSDSSVDGATAVEPGWGCPFCGKTVLIGKSVCQGCGAEMIPGLTRYERLDIRKTGMMVGCVIFLLLFVLIPVALDSLFAWNINAISGLGIYRAALFIVLVLLGGYFATKITERNRLSEPPRFFRNTYG